MYCSSCGKEIPDTSKFCQHCGVQLTTTTTPTLKDGPTKWEYKDFTWNDWPERPWRILSGLGITVDTPVIIFREETWDRYQSHVLRSLQQWTDDGWQPIDEIGSAAIKIRQFKKPLHPIMWIILIFITAGVAIVFLPFLGNQVAEAIEVRIRMRRPVTASDDDQLQETELAELIVEWGLFGGWILKFDIYVDGDWIGTLAYGEAVQKQLGSGNHSIYVKRGATSSKILTLDLKPGEQLKLSCKQDGWGKPFLKVI